MLRVLLVDDSAIIQALYKQFFMKRREFSIASAENGKVALDLIAREGEPDLILLDVNMPIIDGLAFLEEASVSGIPNRVPIIIVSTEGADADVARGLAGGARAYLRKPFRAQELKAVLDRVLGLPQADAAAS